MSKKSYHERIILTDCDGVLADWEWAFHVWMQERGYKFDPEGKTSYQIHHMYQDLTKPESKQLIRTFNESAAIGFLPALRDSVYYVRKLYKKYGYTFRVISSLSLDKDATRLRAMNLKKLFGDAIDDVMCLDTGADKTEALEPYRDSGLYWIEDKPENADLGYDMGLNSLLIEHGHNMNHKCPYPVVKNWKEIYQIITQEK